MKSQDLSFQDIQQVVRSLKNGKVGVIPTDTIYGIVGSALIPETIEKIYKLRKRSSDKLFIILISSIHDLKKFDIQLSEKQKDFLKNIWPNPVSVILPCKSGKFKYLHRATFSLAFRIPDDEKLRELLKQTGPLVAPSANYEGDPPAQTIDEAKKYFGGRVAFYIDGGIIKSEPSTLIKLNVDGSWKVLREGNFKIKLD